MQEKFIAMFLVAEILSLSIVFLLGSLFKVKEKK